MKDLKYLAAYSIPLATLISLKSEGWMTFATVYFAFLIIPVLEMIIGKDSENLSKNAASNKELNPVFDIMLYLNLPIVYFFVYWGIVNISTIDYSLFETAGIVMSLGILLATNAINVGHELGHRSSLFERTLSKMLYLPCLYMHFYIEHNFGHHLNVATPEDPATARYKQNLYSFWITSVVRTYISAWKIQLRLLKVSKRSFFSIRNDMIFYTLFQLLFIALIYYYFGLYITFLSIIMSIISFLFLETINYVEHYGLLRKKESNGRYERVKPHHSWNSNHTIGRIVLYELTRHSDHHFKSSKKYQVLETLDDCPHLPYGYPTSILLSLIPPIWFSIMNPLVKFHMGYKD